jgi:DNA primase
MYKKNNFSQDLIDRILQSIDIVDVIKDYVNLKKVGTNLKGICPFHQEKTPSFVVSEEKQMYHCFGCHEGGNAISFLMKIDKMTFPEAIIALAEKSGIQIPENDILINDIKKLKDKENLFKINERVMNYYHNFLLKSKESETARKYLFNRGINEDIIEIFKLGYAKNSFDNVYSNFIKNRLDVSILQDLSLVKKDKNNKFYDFFRNRIIFPIKNVKGQTIAFGGRVLDDSLPKYLNSSETDIFKKNNTLYALDLALPTVKIDNRILILEGYIDVISLYSYGIKNVVATLGTALTENHLSLLKRYTENIVLIFDGDDAGIKASLRSVDIFLNSSLYAKIVLIPEKLDPDEFIKKYGKTKFLSLLDEAKDDVSYKIDTLINLKKYNLSKFDDREKFLTEIFNMLIIIENKMKLNYAIKKIADITKEKIENIVVAFKDFQRKNSKKNLTNEKNVLNSLKDYASINISDIQIEQDLLDFLLKNPENIEKASNLISLDWIKTENIRNIIQLLFNKKLELKGLDSKDLVRKLFIEFLNLDSNFDLKKEYYNKLFSKIIFSKNIPASIYDFAKKLEEKFLKDKLDELSKSTKKEDILEKYNILRLLKCRENKNG